MSVSPSIVARVALQSSRQEINEKYCSIGALYMNAGRASAAFSIEPTPEIMTARNETLFLIGYARRHNFVKD